MGESKQGRQESDGRTLRIPLGSTMSLGSIFLLEVNLAFLKSWS
jgi:hypothetical protein